MIHSIEIRVPLAASDSEWQDWQVECSLPVELVEALRVAEPENVYVTVRHHPGMPCSVCDAIQVALCDLDGKE